MSSLPVCQQWLLVLTQLVISFIKSFGSRSLKIWLSVVQFWCESSTQILYLEMTFSPITFLLRELKWVTFCRDLSPFKAAWPHLLNLLDWCDLGSQCSLIKFRLPVLTNIPGSSCSLLVSDHNAHWKCHGLKCSLIRSRLTVLTDSHGLQCSLLKLLLTMLTDAITHTMLTDTVISHNAYW